MLSLNYRDARPIYEQVREGLRHLMVTGAIQEGEPLPTAEALASSLAINPNTVRRAYGALAEEGYITQAPGEAPAAAGGGQNAARREALLRQLDEAVRELTFLGMSPKELVRRVERAAQPMGKEPGKARLTVTVTLGKKGKEERP